MNSLAISTLACCKKWIKEHGNQNMPIDPRLIAGLFGLPLTEVTKGKNVRVVFVNAHMLARRIKRTFEIYDSHADMAKELVAEWELKHAVV